MALTGKSALTKCLAPGCKRWFMPKRKVSTCCCNSCYTKYWKFLAKLRKENLFKIRR